MWSYSKKLQYPVKIERPNPAMAKVIISQFGGPTVNWVRRPGIFPAVFYALWRGQRGPDRYRHRRTGPYGDGQRYCIPADPQFDP